MTNWFRLLQWGLPSRNDRLPTEILHPLPSIFLFAQQEIELGISSKKICKHTLIRTNILAFKTLLLSTFFYVNKIEGRGKSTSQLPNWDISEPNAGLEKCGSRESLWNNNRNLSLYKVAFAEASPWIGSLPVYLQVKRMFK